MTFLDRLGLRHPVVQAGMGGGIAGGELAGEVSAAGGLGTVGILPPDALRTELRRARERARDEPLSANLLVPFARASHVRVCADEGVAAVVLHGGVSPDLIRGLKESGTLTLQTVGRPAEATRALAHGADGLVVQGREAGGHLVGVEPALRALERVRAVAAGAPLLLAGGTDSSDDVRRALGAGAAAVVAGTRFLLTNESNAHPDYKRRVLDADSTLETMLFSIGWPMRHRVVPNAATARWCGRSPLGPRATPALARLTRPLARLPMTAVTRAAAMQHPAVPVFGPSAPLAETPARLVDASALYAGESALRIDSVIPAADAVRRLAGVEAPR